MKTLKFYDNLIPLILSGEKTSTWRVLDEKDLSVGDELSLVNKMTGEEFAQAKIVAVREKTLTQLDDADFDAGHERYASPEKMLEEYRLYYGDSVTMDTIVKLISFKLL